MKNSYKKVFLSILSFGFIMSCSNNFIIPTENNIIITDEMENDNNEDNNENPNENYKILSLGDSYTIGQSVCETCRFPVQLKDSLLNSISNSTYELQIIAQTGWTTTALKDAIDSQNPANDKDIVTLLIGVNNQFQNSPFSVYETEFPELVDTAIFLANGDKTNVIVISIPDYAFTPFGNGNITISQEIDNYNTFAENYCNQNNITYVYITDITREGLTNPSLVAQDNLHPSELAYSRIVERLLQDTIEKLQ